MPRVYLVESAESSVTGRGRREPQNRAIPLTLTTIRCATCTRSFHFLARTQPDAERDAIGVQCWYEVGEDEDHSEHPHDSHGHPALASAASHGRKRKAAEALNTDPDPDPDPGLKIQQLEMKIGEYHAKDWICPFLTLSRATECLVRSHEC